MSDEREIEYRCLCGRPARHLPTIDCVVVAFAADEPETPPLDPKEPQ